MKEALNLALEALNDMACWQEGREVDMGFDEPYAADTSRKAITAIKKALSKPEQKYHRGDRLICLETEEYCVIHISGTDRQWVKFPDSHIGVYTNEQVAELFELLPKKPEQDNTYMYASSLATSIWQKHYIKESPKFALLDTTEGVLTQIDNMTCGLVREKPAQPEQEPVAWMSKEADIVYTSIEVDGYFQHDHIPLYTTPPQIEVGCAECGVGGGHALYCVACAEKFVGEAATKLQQKQETIEGLNRDYDLLFAEHQLLLKKEWVVLTDDDKVLIKHDANFNQFMTAGEYADRVQQLTEARLKDLNT